jgi:hypothetical protein
MLTASGSSKARKALRFSDEKIDEILDCLDQLEVAVGRVRRKHGRAKWRRKDLVVSIDEGAEKNLYEVATRNISVGGISFLHVFMLTPGQEVGIRFSGPRWTSRDVYARVVRCRRLEGSVFEIAVRYASPGMGQRLLESVLEHEEEVAERY